MKKMPLSWTDFAQQEENKPYYKELITFVEAQYASTLVFPPKEEVFTALELCSPEDVKVVLLGQDPYHGVGQAHGLAFSVGEEITRLPPSLRNIFKEVASDVGANHSSGSLLSWAEQGVLMINATLTVRSGEPLSHAKKGWEEFTDNIIRYVSSTQKNVVYILWGGNAKKKVKLINEDENLILTANHPSPLSANRGGFFGCKHFSKTNEYLKKYRNCEIEW